MMQKTCIVILSCMLIYGVFSVFVPIGRCEDTSGDTLYVGGSAQGNYTSIQDAINNADNNDTIYVYNGTYYENIELDKSIKLIGEENTKIDGSTSTEIIDADVMNIYAEGVYISGFTIQNARGSNPKGIDVHSNHTTITGNSIINSIGWGVYLEKYSSNNTIKNNIISNCYFGISLIQECKNNTISANTIINNNNNGITLKKSSTRNTLSDNSITNNDVGIFLIDASSENILSKNIIQDNNQYGIQISNNAFNNTITGNNLINNRNSNIHISYSSSNNTITSNTIADSNYGLQITQSSDYNIISDNTFTNNLFYGIETSFCVGNRIIQNSITNNMGYGIYLHDDSFNNIDGNTIIYNGEGVVLLRTSNNTISSNSIKNSNYSGIQLSIADQNNISGNTINHNHKAGIWAWSSSNNTVTKNAIIGNNVSINFSDNCYDNYIYDNVFSIPKPDFLSFELILGSVITAIVLVILLLFLRRKSRN